MMTRLFSAVLFGTALRGCLSEENEGSSPPRSSLDDAPPSDVVVVKVGGSSITDKARKETLLEPALRWFARTVALHSTDDFRGPPSSERTCHSSSQHSDDESSVRPRNNFSAFVLVHGAGSFGHHTAKEYGLQGFGGSPNEQTQNLSAAQRRYQMNGLSRTRRSVQKLNQLVVQALLDEGLNAVGVSPCFGTLPGLPAYETSWPPSPSLASVAQNLRDVVQSALLAGLIPVLHGDACLCGGDAGAEMGCILSGDTITEVLGRAPFVSRAVFLTDVDGVYTRDPRSDPSALLLPEIAVTPAGDIVLVEAGLEASGSTHEHDVTGGLKTKLSAAARIAASGKNVTIARCGSRAAEKVFIPSEDRPNHCTVLFPLQSVR